MAAAVDELLDFLIEDTTDDTTEGADDDADEDADEDAGEDAAPSVDLHQLLTDFVRIYDNMKQRDASWYASMGVTCGGSELAAIMGQNPYSSFYDVVVSKITSLSGGSTWDGGSEACWWGVLFEDIIGACVEIDLSAKIKGDEICIREIPGHRNSPDGYLVARFYRGEGGGWHMWTSDMAATIRVTERIVMLEFKCPISRKPTLAVPRHYRPQLQSGLMVSPVAHMALFVDAVFRKCSLDDMGDTPAFDTEYHRRDRGLTPPWERPVAWGLVGVYAPLLTAPRHVRFGWRGAEWHAGDPSSDAPDADASMAAWQIHSAYFGLRWQQPAASARSLSTELVDFGDMGFKDFNRALGLMNRGVFKVTRVTPCFADGRGHDLHTGAGIRRTFEQLRRETPEHHCLLGFLPWKLFEINYIPTERRPGFAEEVLPLIKEVHQIVTDAVASGDPITFINTKVPRFARVAPPAGKTSLDAGSVQDLFDSLA